MSSLNIIDKINEDYLSEAKEQCDIILRDASSKAEGIISAAKKQADVILSDAEKRGEEEIRRANLVASLDSRKATLEAKRSLIEQVFSSIADRIDAFDDDRWAALISSLILSAGADGGERVYVSRSVAPRFEKLKILENINRQGHFFEYCGITDKISSGIMLSNDTADIDCSMESVISDWRSRHENDIANILFGEE